MSGFTVPSWAYDYFPLKLYNVSKPRETAVRADSGNVDGTTRFYTPFDNFTRFYPPFPQYPVNNDPTKDRTGDDFYWIREPGGTRIVPANDLVQKDVSDATVFPYPLAFVNTPVGLARLNGTPVGRVETTDVPDEPPPSPEKWEDYLQFLAYSDYNLNYFLAQNEFRIPNVGLGLIFTKDPVTGDFNSRIDMTYEGLVWRNMGVLNPMYDYLNRESILLRATLNSPAAKIAQDNESRVGKASDSNAPGTTSLIPVLQNPLSIGLRGSANVASNPILDRLLALQAPDRGLLVAGFDTQLNVNNSKQLAASQAGLDVQPNAAFRQNVEQLTQPYVTTPQPPQAPQVAQNLQQISQQQLSRQMDGRIPLVAVLPNGSNPLQSATTASAADIRPTVGVEDATSKKSGAPNPFLYMDAFLLSRREHIPYMPLPQPSQGEQSWTFYGDMGGSSQQGMTYQQGGGQNPFAGFGSGQQQSQQEQQQAFRRRHLSFVA